MVDIFKKFGEWGCGWEIMYDGDFSTESESYIIMPRSCIAKEVHLKADRMSDTKVD